MFVDYKISMQLHQMYVRIKKKNSVGIRYLGGSLL